MKVLAIDVGTASVSAAVAEKSHEGKFFVCDVLKYPYNASDSNASMALLRNLEKIFSESLRLYSGIQKVFVGFSSPLCLEKIISAEFIRQNPELLILEPEFEMAIENLQSRIKGEMLSITHDIIETKINGYTVSNPLGHKGETMEIKANLLLLSPSFKNYLEELRDKFFPASEFKFFSDFSILKKAVLKFFSPKEEFLILDIGGEVSVFGDFTFPFGLRTIERRTASLLNISDDASQSFFKRFSFGYLDYPSERMINKVLEFSAEVLRDMLTESLDKLSSQHRFSKIFITGAGANFSQFFKIFGENLIAEVGTLEAQNFDNVFLKRRPLSGGEDAVLAALISVYA